MMSKSLLLALVATLVSSELVKRDPYQGTGTDEVEGTHLKYTYDGASGPQYWSLIAPTCGGKYQTPINIEPTSHDWESLNGNLPNAAKNLPLISWPTSTGFYENKGHTIQFNLDSSAYSAATFDRGTGGGGIFNLLQYHVHGPSEHRVDGVEWPLEIHFVHKNLVSGALAVIGAFVDIGEISHPLFEALATETATLAHHQKQDTSKENPFLEQAAAKIKSSESFFRYTGSLTTPPCTEGVKWLIAKGTTFNVSLSDYKKIKSKIHYSARETMPLYDMYDAKWFDNRKTDYLPEGGSISAPVSGGH